LNAFIPLIYLRKCNFLIASLVECQSRASCFRAELVVELHELPPVVVIVEGALEASLGSHHELEPVPLLRESCTPVQCVNGEEGEVKVHLVVNDVVVGQLGRENNSILLSHPVGIF